MRKLFLLAILICGVCPAGIFPFGASEYELLPKTEYTNELTNRRFLVLAQKSDYAGLFLEQFWPRIQQTHSLTVDDLANLPEYNFAFYNGVLIIEKIQNGSAPVLDEYLQIYSGANNIVLHALDGEYTAPYPLKVVTANSAERDEEILMDTVDTVFFRLREK